LAAQVRKTASSRLPKSQAARGKKRCRVAEPDLLNEIAKAGASTLISNPDPANGYNLFLRLPQGRLA